MSDYPEKTYNFDEVLTFDEQTEPLSGLSNMAEGFSVYVNGCQISTVEALFQACRFPHNPQLQKEIVSQDNPILARMIGHKHLSTTRRDWDFVGTRIMWWCLRVKLAQNTEKFGELLKSTGTATIVEVSDDQFWGAKRDGQILKGSNALGKLLMEVRRTRAAVIDTAIPPKGVERFLLFGKEIGWVMARQKPSGATDLT